MSKIHAEIPEKSTSIKLDGDDCIIEKKGDLFVKAKHGGISDRSHDSGSVNSSRLKRNGSSKVKPKASPLKPSAVYILTLGFVTLRTLLMWILPHSLEPFIYAVCSINSALQCIPCWVYFIMLISESYIRSENKSETNLKPRTIALMQCAILLGFVASFGIETILRTLYGNCTGINGKHALNEVYWCQYAQRSSSKHYAASIPYDAAILSLLSPALLCGTVIEVSPFVVFGSQLSAIVLVVVAIVLSGPGATNEQILFVISAAFLGLCVLWEKRRLCGLLSRSTKSSLALDLDASSSFGWLSVPAMLTNRGAAGKFAKTSVHGECTTTIHGLSNGANNGHVTTSSSKTEAIKLPTLRFISRDNSPEINGNGSVGCGSGSNNRGSCSSSNSNENNFSSLQSPNGTAWGAQTGEQSITGSLKVEDERFLELKHMIANTAHDLKTPLTAFMNGIELANSIIKDMELRLDYLPSYLARQLDTFVVDIREDLQALHMSLHNMSNTNSFMLMSINRCIDYSKASHGISLVPRPETFAIKEAFELPLGCIRDMYPQSLIQVKFVSHPQAICSYVITDKQWLQENVLCLVSNAVKYSNSNCEVNITVRLSSFEGLPSSPRMERQTSNASTGSARVIALSPAMMSHNSGSIVIDKQALSQVQSINSSARTSSRDSMIYLVIEVEDSGIGLSSAAMAKLFEPFQQAQRMTGGTGLGLYSLSLRTQALGGKYGVLHRKDRQGCIFWFAVPYHPDTVTAAHSVVNLLALSTSTRSTSQETNPTSRIFKSNDTASQEVIVYQSGNNAVAKDEVRISARISETASVDESNGIAPKSTPSPISSSIIKGFIKTPATMFAPLSSTSSPNSMSMHPSVGEVASEASNSGYGLLGPALIDVAASNVSLQHVALHVESELCLQNSADKSNGNKSATNNVSEEKSLHFQAGQLPHSSAFDVSSATISTASPSLGSTLPSGFGRQSSGQHAMSTQRSFSSDGYTASCLRVLIVDDSPSILKLSSMMLKRKGYDVDTAENGAIALSKLRLLGPFDIVLMDIQMPVMDGLEATRRIRERELAGDTPVGCEMDIIYEDNTCEAGTSRSQNHTGTNHEGNSVDNSGSQGCNSRRGSMEGITSLSIKNLTTLNTMNKIYESNSSSAGPNFSLRSLAASNSSMKVYHNYEMSSNASEVEGSHYAQRQFIIGLSACSDNETIAEAFQAGIDVFISKPFTMDSFKSAILHRYQVSNDQ